MDYQQFISNNYFQVRQNIEKAANKSGRNTEEIKIIAVTKKQPVEVIKAAYACGMRKFGENYAEEGIKKIIALNQLVDIEWHMIGHIQSRKTKLVCEGYHYVHSLDSLKLAGKLNTICMQKQRRLPVLLEVNVSGEISKNGFKAEDLSDWQKLLVTIDQLASFDNIEIQGLMTMPPLTANPQESINCFRMMRELQIFLQNNRPIINWKELSMGTSFDYEVAIEHGATMVRIGEAILGPRIN